ncbi:MAG: hypothetical protein GX240_06595 [Candidatus Atribacteria bacterium]|nr:hypothetical protein [Candidatus Atribacteria bacterium]
MKVHGGYFKLILDQSYGLYAYPNVKTLQLKPVLSAKAKVIQINRIRVDESVSYEGIFRPDP